MLNRILHFLLSHLSSINYTSNQIHHTHISLQGTLSCIRCYRSYIKNSRLSIHLNNLAYRSYKLDCYMLSRNFRQTAFRKCILKSIKCKLSNRNSSRINYRIKCKFSWLSRVQSSQKHSIHNLLGRIRRLRNCKRCHKYHHLELKGHIHKYQYRFSSSLIQKKWKSRLTCRNCSSLSYMVSRSKNLLAEWILLKFRDSFGGCRLVLWMWRDLERRVLKKSFILRIV